MIFYNNLLIKIKKVDSLLIKPHPGNLEIKMILLIKRLKAENFTILNSEFEKKGSLNNHNQIWNSLMIAFCRNLLFKKSGIYCVYA